MDLRSLNLNLLTALDVLVREANVTRAGQRLGLSQPAMSNVLGQLRRLLDDPVLVRSGRGMAPTPRALELVGPVRKALAELERALTVDHGFAAARSDRVFRIAAMDHAWVTLLPRLARRITEEAPGIRVDLVPYVQADAAADLESGVLDAAVAVGRRHGRGAGFRRAELYDDNFDCLVRKGHPIVKHRLTLGRFVECGHVVASPSGRRGGLVDRALKRQGLARRVHVIVSNFAAAPFVVAQTDLITTIPRGVARPFAEMLDLRVFPPPVAIEGGPWFLIWHQRSERDPAEDWLRARILEIGAGLRGTT
jgi:DNA-binding transcriptional LysR family regulator